MDGAQFFSIRVGRHGIEEWSEERRTAFIPAAEVQALSIGRGFTAERPLLQALVGAAMVSGGLYYVLEMLLPYVAHVVDAPWNGHRGAAYPVVVAPLLLILGGWGLYTALRRGTYVVVETPRGRRKLQVDGPSEDTLLSEYLAGAMKVMKGA